jgi:excisionase family DNA binding protein
MKGKNIVPMPDAATGQMLATDFIDTVELCRRLGCSRRTASNLRRRGKLPAVILGRLVRFHWDTVKQKLLREAQ